MEKSCDAILITFFGDVRTTASLKWWRYILSF